MRQLVRSVARVLDGFRRVEGAGAVVSVDDILLLEFEYFDMLMRNCVNFDIVYAKYANDHRFNCYVKRFRGVNYLCRFIDCKTVTFNSFRDADRCADAPIACLATFEQVTQLLKPQLLEQALVFALSCEYDGITDELLSYRLSEIAANWFVQADELLDAFNQEKNEDY